MRKDMSEAQREQLTELLDDTYEHFLDTIAAARGKTREVRQAWGNMLGVAVCHLQEDGRETAIIYLELNAHGSIAAAAQSLSVFSKLVCSHAVLCTT